MSRFRPYDAYKVSGTAWIKEIPATWEVKPNGRLFREVDDRNHPNLPLLNVSISSGVSTREFSATRIEQKAEDFSIYKRTKRGDVVFNKMRMWQGAVGVTPEDGLVSPDYTVARPTADINSRFFELLFRTPTYLTEIDRYSHGIVRDRNRLYWDGFKQMKSVFPANRVDQDAIVSAIDSRVGKIDTLIQKKQRLIELLNEKRAALISHAVTKGLDPGVPMRASGVEWIGDVPAHWAVAPIYARYEVALGKMLDSKSIEGDNMGSYLRNIDVQWDRVNVEDLPQMDFAPSERSRYQLRLGDLLVCEGGEVGRTAMWRGGIEECFYQKAIHRIRPLSEAECSRFFYYFMHAAAKSGVFVAGGNPNTIAHLTAVQLRHCRYPFPPGEEQVAAAALLDRETARIDDLMTKNHQAIDLLKEYRAALISSAVTGQIDVRNEV